MDRAQRPLIDRIDLDRFALLLWLAVVLVCLFVFWTAIATLDLRDNDDYLRIVQVRDLLAGQSWFDVTQYRINPEGGGGLMHWSRFIDMQIAALILLLRVFLAPDLAERWALAIYPLLLILPLFLLLVRVLAMLGDRRQVVGGMLVAATGVTFLHYFVPLRVDHHNWQLLLSVAMLWLALRPPSFARGLIAALVIAAHVEISLEGLPYLAIFGALFALDWLRDPRAASRLAGFAAGLAVIPALWSLVFRGWQSFVTVHCDAFAPSYASGAAATGLVLFACMQVRGLTTSWQRRFVALALAGVAGAGVFMILGRPCLGGPFGELEPLVRHFWYDRVMEGRPVWAQDRAIAALFFTPTLVGFGAAIWAWRRARGGDFADNWSRLLFVLLCSVPLSMIVFRTGSTTHAYLVPAFGTMAAGLWDWSRAKDSALARIGGTMLVLTAIPAFDAQLAEQAMLAVLPDETLARRKPSAADESCPTQPMLAALAREPATLIFAPLDLGPSILVRTRHSVIATGHHRNHRAMNQVITAFLSDPARARPIVEASDAGILLLCTQLPESENLARVNPQGLAGRLIRGETVDWLAYDAKLSQGQLRVYRIRRSN